MLRCLRCRRWRSAVEVGHADSSRAFFASYRAPSAQLQERNHMAFSSKSRVAAAADTSTGACATTPATGMAIDLGPIGSKVSVRPARPARRAVDRDHEALRAE